MFYRVRQFIWAVVSSFKELDYNYIDLFLNGEEKTLFFKLIKSEQQHCIRVSKDMLATLNIDINKIDKKEIYIGKLGLLHDVGKIEGPSGPVSKSIIVILDKISKGKLKKFNQFKRVDVYYNHAKKGLDILKALKESKYSDVFLEAVESHHRSSEYINNKSNEYLKLLKLCDERN